MSEMIIERGQDELLSLLKRQLLNLFHFSASEDKCLSVALITALKRTAYSFSFSKNKYYTKKGKVYFNPYQSSQNCIFLFFLSNTLARNGDNCLADRVYYLNKLLNSADLYHQIQLPEIFFLDHPVGAVIGRATFGNFFSFCQNCTVGNNRGIFPRIGENVKMKAGSTILGDCDIANNVIIGAGALVKDESIPENSLVFGQSPNLVIKTRPMEYFKG